MAHKDPEKAKAYRVANREKRNAQSRAWRAANPEKVRAAHRAWETANPEKAKARHARWRAANKEKRNAQSRAWNAANAEKCTARNRAWYAANREKISAKARERASAWKKDNPGKVNACKQLRRAGKLRATPAWVDKTAVRKKYEMASILGLTVDHIVPLKSPVVCGLHWEGNLQLLPAQENFSKGNRLYG